MTRPSQSTPGIFDLTDEPISRTRSPARDQPPRNQSPRGLIADWRDFVLLHFAVPPEKLAPHVPYPLDLYDGHAFVSLVAFRFEHVRPAGGRPAWLGRLLLRAVSDHEFLNVRTYVRGPAGPGIHFLAEWIDNPISRRLGPLTYGLPYRLARLQRDELAGAGLRRIAVHDRDSGARAILLAPTTPDHAPREVEPGSAGEFLLERYLAYTHHRGVGRVFAVRHAAWRAAAFQLARFDPTLIETAFPWFRHATFFGGHVADGFRDVAMSPPRRLHAAAEAPGLAGALPHPIL